MTSPNHLRNTASCLLGPILPSSNFNNLIRIILVSALFSLFFLFTSGFTFPGGAFQFTEYANALVNGKHLDVSIAQRDIGFPLMLWLSGYPYHHSFIVIALIQAFMATMIPVFCYLCVRPVFPNLAYYAAWAVILTLSPFYFIKWIHHDQSYVFFTLLSTCLLISYIAYKKPSLLIALTIAVILASLTRPAGNVFYPLVMLCAFFFARGPIKLYVLSIMIFVLSITFYSYHRYEIFDIAHLKSVPSYTGRQIFYNLYINSKEYGIELNRDFSDSMKTITEQVYSEVSNQSDAFQTVMQLQTSYSMNEFFKPYTPLQLMDQLFKRPNWEYFEVMTENTIADKLFLEAAWDIAKAYPWYVPAYTARNLWHFLYSPGYTHSRFNANPFGKMGIRGAFVFDPENSKQYTDFSARGINEIAYDAFSHQPKVVKVIYNGMRRGFIKSYDSVNRYLFYCMFAGWLAVCLWLVRNMLPFKSLRTLSAALATPIIAAVTISVGLILLQNLLIACMFAEPSYRYNHFILPLKIILAFYGIGIVAHFLNPGHASTQTYSMFKNERLTMQTGQLRTALLLGAFILTSYAFWAYHLWRHTSV